MGETTVNDIPTPVQWKGRAVPWITRWTDERPDELLRLLKPDWDGERLWIHQPGALEAGGGEEREAGGYLWQHEGIMRGGRPEFAQVSTYRQRAAMRKRLCQVCGKKITSPVISWLFADNQIEIGPRGELLTLNAPTCDPCVDIARALCPHLYPDGGQVIKVLEYELWGVLGEMVRLVVGQDGMPRIQHDPPGMIPYVLDPDQTPVGFYPTAVLAKQQVVRLTKHAPLKP